MAEALLEYSLGRVTEPFRELALSDESAASRPYGYVYFDTMFLATSPYDLGGMHSDDMLCVPEFSFWRDRLTELHTAIAEIIRQGSRARRSWSWIPSSPNERPPG